jgi:hypothetical protein
VFLEASRKHATDVRGQAGGDGHPWQLRAIRERVMGRPRSSQSRPRRDPHIIDVEQEVDRTSKALKELGIENTLQRANEPPRVYRTLGSLSPAAFSSRRPRIRRGNVADWFEQVVEPVDPLNTAYSTVGRFAAARQRIHR